MYVKIYILECISDGTSKFYIRYTTTLVSGIWVSFDSSFSVINWIFGMVDSVDVSGRVDTFPPLSALSRFALDVSDETYRSEKLGRVTADDGKIPTRPPSVVLFLVLDLLFLPWYSPRMVLMVFNTKKAVSCVFW